MEALMDFYGWLEEKGRLTHSDWIEIRNITSRFDQLKSDSFIKDTLRQVEINQFLSDKYPKYNQEFHEEREEERRLLAELKAKAEEICSECGAVNPDRCSGCRKCLECHKRDYPPDGDECEDCGFDRRNDD